MLEAALLLDDAPVNFSGNIEGKDIFQDHADVIVADGFVGNAILKTGEGIISALRVEVRETLLGGNIFTKLGAAMLAPALRGLARRFD